MMAIDSLGHPKKQDPALRMMVEALGKLWLNDVNIDWKHFYQAENRRRLPLPTYPFEQARYWVDPPPLPTLAPLTLPMLEVPLMTTAVSNSQSRPVVNQTDPTPSEEHNKTMSRQERKHPNPALSADGA